MPGTAWADGSEPSEARHAASSSARPAFTIDREAPKVTAATWSLHRPAEHDLWVPVGLVRGAGRGDAEREGAGGKGPERGRSGEVPPLAREAPEGRPGRALDPMDRRRLVATAGRPDHGAARRPSQHLVGDLQERQRGQDLRDRRREAGRRERDRAEASVTGRVVV